MADATRLNFDAPRPVEATPAPSVAPLFAATPRATVTPDAPLFADSVRRHRLAVTIDQLRLACGAEVDERVLTDAAAALRYVRAEALTPMAAADVGVEPQAAFAAIADDLISLGTAAATADVGRDVEELAATVDGFAHWWTPTPPPERLARVRAIAERLRDAVPRLDALATDVAVVRSRVDTVIHDLMVQLAVLAYLRTPTVPPVPTEAVDVLGDRQASVGQTLVAARLAVGELGLVSAAIGRHRRLATSATLAAVPAWCVSLVATAHGDAGHRRSLAGRIVAALRVAVNGS